MGNETLRRADSSQRFGEEARRVEGVRRAADVAGPSSRLRASQNQRDLSPSGQRPWMHENMANQSGIFPHQQRSYSPSPSRNYQNSQPFYPRWDLIADASEFANHLLNTVSEVKLNPNITHLSPFVNTSYLPPRVKTALMTKTLELDATTILTVEEARMVVDSPSVSAGTPRTRTEGSPMMNYLVRARGGRAISNTPSPRSPATSYCEESPHFAGGARGRGTPSSQGLDSSGGGRSELCGPGHQLSFGAPVLGVGMAPHLISFGAGASHLNQHRNPSPHGFSFQAGQQSPSQGSTPPSKLTTSQIPKGPQAVIAEEEDDYDEPVRHNPSRSNSSSDSIRDVRELVSGSRGKRSLHKSSQGSQNEQRREDSTTAGDYESARRQLLLKVGSSLQSKESVGSRGLQPEAKGVIQSLDSRVKERDTVQHHGTGHQVFSAGVSAEDKRRPTKPYDYPPKVSALPRQSYLDQSMGYGKLRDIGNIEHNHTLKDHMVLRKSYTNSGLANITKENKLAEDNRLQPKQVLTSGMPKYSPRCGNQPTWTPSNIPSSARAGYTTQNWAAQQPAHSNLPIRAAHGIMGMQTMESARVNPSPSVALKQSNSRAQSGSRDAAGNQKAKPQQNPGFSIRIDIGTLCNKLTSQMPEFS